jgi:hypothetical protein
MNEACHSDYQPTETDFSKLVARLSSGGRVHKAARQSDFSGADSYL